MRMGKVVRYSEAFKLQVLREIEEGRFSSRGAAARTYGISGNGTIEYWARKYGKADWERIKAESAALEEHMARLLSEGEAPDGEKARAGAEELRRHIDRWFYPCSVEMHVGLADMYEADARFRAHYDERAEGLASFVAAAIRANASRRGA